MRMDVFTWAEDRYGEIIYGTEQGDWHPESYGTDRLKKKSHFYIGNGEKGIQCILEKNDVWVKYEGMGVNMQKSFQRKNPVKIIREGRR